MRLAIAIEFFRGEFEAEERAGFPRLSQIPDTMVRCFLRHFHRLSPKDASLLKSAIAKRATYPFVDLEQTIPLTDAESAAIDQWSSALGGRWSEYRNCRLKQLKSFVGLHHRESSGKNEENREQFIPAEIIQWVDSLTVCKAADLRKIVKRSCAESFGFAAINEGGGNWVYRQSQSQGPFELDIDYGGTWGQQLRYAVRFHAGIFGKCRAGLQYESLLGAGM